MADPPRKRTDTSVGHICELIEKHADRENLPRPFFARLIWKESRFDAQAESPAAPKASRSSCRRPRRCGAWPTRSTSSRQSPPRPAS